MTKQLVSALALILITATYSCNSSTDHTQPKIINDTLDEAAETEAIMKVIAGETEAFFKGDYPGWTKFWSHENYVFQGWNNDDGTADAAIGWNKIDSQGKDWISKYYKDGKNIVHPTVRKEKPLVKFFNNKSAYLTWRQYNANKDNTLYITSQETRIMEKNDGGWKIVNVTAFWGTQPRIPFDSLQIK